MKRSTEIVSAAALGGLLAVLLTRALQQSRRDKRSAVPNTAEADVKGRGQTTPGTTQAAPPKPAPGSASDVNAAATAQDGRPPAAARASSPVYTETRDRPVPASESTGRLPWGLLIGLCLGLYFTLTYFVSPATGAQRRARAMRWLKRLPGRAQDGFWAFVRHEDPLPEVDESEETKRWMPDRLLRDQIRQALGGLLPHPKEVRVRVRRGFVRLAGTVPEDLRAELIKIVQEVPGVMELEDRLNVR